MQISELKRPAEAAQWLRMSVKTLREHVRAGHIRYINIGLGRKHVRMVFADSDLEEFLETRMRRDVEQCQSVKGGRGRRITSISSSGVVDFIPRPPRPIGAKR